MSQQVVDSAFSFYPAANGLYKTEPKINGWALLQK